MALVYNCTYVEDGGDGAAGADVCEDGGGDECVDGGDGAGGADIC